jgi:hypothetical protein
MIASDFPAFFRAVWGYDPFPWQFMLDERAAGRWPVRPAPVFCNAGPARRGRLQAFVHGSPGFSRRPLVPVEGVLP